MRRNSILQIIVFTTLLIALAVNIYGRREEFLKKEETEEMGRFLYNEIYRDNELIGYSFNTKDVAPEVKGFGGNIEMLVGLDKNGDIKNIKLLHHNESSVYGYRITEPEFLSQFKGKGHNDKFVIGDDVDGMTHATISSTAVAMTLKASVDKVHGLIQGSEKEQAKARHLNLNPDFYITVFIITFLLIAFYLKLSWLRYIGLCISIAYFGFIKANFISMSNLGSIFLWRVPDFATNINWFTFIFSSIILTFLLGRFYCLYVCPFGGLQLFLSKIFKFKIAISQGLARHLRHVRYILLWLLTVLVLVLDNPNIVNYEPFTTVFLRRGSVIAWSIVIIIFVLSLFHYRPFCSYFCASGAFLDILSDIRAKIFRRHRGHFPRRRGHFPSMEKWKVWKVSPTYGNKL